MIERCIATTAGECTHAVELLELAREGALGALMDNYALFIMCKGIENHGFLLVPPIHPRGAGTGQL